MNAVVGGIPAKTRWALRGALVMICAVALLAAAGGQALGKSKKHKPKKPHITTHTPLTRGTTYLALGDSVPFGYEEPEVVPPPDYPDASTFTGYPELVGSAVHVTVANAACPGETSSSLIDATAQSNGCENSPTGGLAYRTKFPLHVSYSGSQLDYAVSYLKKHKKVRLVSLMIGANDFFVCQKTTPDQCSSLTEQAGVIKTVGSNVAKILSEIRNKAHYRGQLAIVNYYSLDYSPASTTTTQIMALNTVIDSAAAPFKVVIADGFSEFAAGSVHSGDSPCKAGLLTQLSTGTCGIHPSYSGQALLAHALEKAVRLS